MRNVKRFVMASLVVVGALALSLSTVPAQAQQKGQKGKGGQGGFGGQGGAGPVGGQQGGWGGQAPSYDEPPF